MKKLLKERFQQLAGIIPLYSTNEGMSDEEWADAEEAERLAQHPERDKIMKVQQMVKGEKQEDKWEFFDLKFGWMTELPEDIKVTVPDLYGPSLGEPAQKINTKFPPGTTNIGYTLQGWFEEFEKKYPEALFYVDEQNNTVEVADTREEGINLKWFEDVEASELKRVNNKDTLGLTSPYGNKIDKWS